MPTLEYRGEIVNELTKFLMKFKHLIKLARPTLPEPSTMKPRSTRALQTILEKNGIINNVFYRVERGLMFPSDPTTSSD